MHSLVMGVTMQTRKDVEGSLFLLKRQTQPRFKIIILNKKSQGVFSFS